MATKHTPGPWTVDGTVAFGAYGVWTKDADPRNRGHDGAGYQVQICSMNPMDRDTPIGKEERDANARLIAAAPTMAETIRDQAAWIERLLQQLEHHDVRNARGDVTNGFAGAVVPEWELRQKLEGLKEDLALIEGEAAV